MLPQYDQQITKRWDSLDESVADQQHAFDLARDRYRKGIVTFIDVLDTDRRLGTARQNAQQGEV